MSFFYSPIFIILLIVFSIIILILLISGYECSSYIIKEYSLHTNKITKTLKIVFFSDLHNKIYKDDNICVIKDIISINPDYLIIGGDLIDFSAFNKFIGKIGINNALKFLSKLDSEIRENDNLEFYNNKRIFFQSGNHELRLKNESLKNGKFIKEYKEFLNYILKSNINLIDNKKYTDDKNCIAITGFDMFDGYYVKSFRHDKVKKTLNINDIDENLLNLDISKYNIALFHKPDYAENFIDLGFDLVISGHNHGGLIKFPIFGALFSPDFKLFPKYNYGHYKYKEKDIIVSSGLGEHFVKIRVNNKPEICVINISNGAD